MHIRSDRQDNSEEPNILDAIKTHTSVTLAMTFLFLHLSLTTCHPIIVLNYDDSYKNTA